MKDNATQVEVRENEGAAYSFVMHVKEGQCLKRSMEAMLGAVREA